MPALTIESMSEDYRRRYYRTIDEMEEDSETINKLDIPNKDSYTYDELLDFILGWDDSLITSTKSS